MVRKNAGVQHVRIGQYNVPALPNCFSRIAPSVAVVREYAETVVETFGQILQFSQLILGQRFGWEQIQIFSRTAFKTGRL